MFYEPMLLETRAEAFDSAAHIYEPKIDGHRLQLHLSGGQVRLFTRHKNDCTRQYPELWNVPTEAEELVLDGEVASVDPETGIFDFERVMERFQLKKADRIHGAAERRPVNFVVFDILQLNGQDLRGLPLMDRKRILADVLRPNEYFTLISFVDGRGRDLFEAISARKWEGIVGKVKGSSYVGRRSPDWLKIIRWEYHDVFIAGYRKSELGWLVYVQEEGRLRPAGIVELGVTIAAARAFYGVSKQLVVGEKGDFVYLEPKIQARVKTRNWTKAGMLRQPAFVEFIL
ncbi:ATP-dependent DNA ligase [Paenibacillus oleatilyticus]|uniref:ATP-dependent DNA ligase n=1 Tax=Paenibacillus oleatilyticus TaxID=2594886 RepID=UPI001C1FE0B6|nr:ATP-dependent DNA ligase [Paenibacillus oleatilyticus]MBU7319043.1 ATP-dependent DNA ligase [Paenibacillus oleatilyticus]